MACANSPGPGPAPDLHVEVVSDERRFLELQPAWDGLVEEACVDHPFLTHGWVRTWWECFGEGKTLHSLVVREGDDVIAIAPLMRSEGRFYGFKASRLESLGNDHTPCFDFLVARRPDEAYDAIWSALSSGGGWDVLQLRQLRSSSRTLPELSERARRDGFLTSSWQSEVSPYLRFTGRWEDYYKSRSRNHRAKVRKGFHRLQSLGEVALEVVAGCDGVEAALEAGLRIESAAWKGRNGTAMDSRTDVRRFYETLAGRAADLGLLRLYFLTSGSLRVAFAYALEYRRAIFVLKAGYDPKYARYSPYNLLCMLVFRDAFERGLTRYEFLGNDEPWKLAWTDETDTYVWLFVLPDGRRARWIHQLKFEVVPRLQRSRTYLALRDAVTRRRLRRALPERESMARPRTWREYWESLALSPHPCAAIDGWELSRAHYARKCREVAALLDPRPCETVLNVGSGTGFLETVAAGTVRRWVAVDLAWNMARRTKESNRNNGTLQAVQANAVALPFASGAFDKAVAHAVTQYLSLHDVGRLIREMARVTAPGARLVIGDIPEDPIVGSLWSRLHEVYRREGLRGVALRLLLRLSAPARVLANRVRYAYLAATGALRLVAKPAPIAHFSRSELIGIAERCGLAVELVEKGSGAFYRRRFSLVLTKRALMVWPPLLAGLL